MGQLWGSGATLAARGSALMAGGANRGRCSVWLCAACQAPLQGQLGEPHHSGGMAEPAGGPKQGSDQGWGSGRLKSQGRSQAGGGGACIPRFLD